MLEVLEVLDVHLLPSEAPNLLRAAGRIPL